MRLGPSAAAVAAALALAGCSAAPAAQTSQTAAGTETAPTSAPAAPPTQAPHVAPTIGFEVTSTQPLHMIEYTDGGTGAPVEILSPPTPWSKTVPFAGVLASSVHLVSVGASGTLGHGATVTCTVTVNGAVKTRNSGTDAAMCVASW